MIKSINNLPYKDQQYGTFLVKNIIKSKRKLGLGNNQNEILSNELHKPRKINFSRRKVISNYIDYNKNETKGYPTPCFMQLHKCSYNHQGINLISD